MIARTPTRVEAPGWQRELREGFSSVEELLRFLDLRTEDLSGAIAAARDFQLRVPRSFAARMRRGDPRDPLLLQVLPRGEERDAVPGFRRDPLGEEAESPVPGLLRKYRGRALWIVTGACAVHCRYCFRRHFPYDEHQDWSRGWPDAIRHLEEDPSVEEVILSGGDPLTVPDERLSALAARLDAIPHVRRLRIHTRWPVVLPSRVDARLLDWLEATRLATVVVLHANHAAELDSEVAGAVSRLRSTGAVLLNQSVLLRGVNDSVEALEALSRRLFAIGVLPYYLHLLDPVAGAAHFEVPEPVARQLWSGLSDRLPGYLVPRLAREVPGEGAKRVLGS
jgi:EF-P beta-lysylation protein EpmB